MKWLVFQIISKHFNIFTFMNFVNVTFGLNFPLSVNSPSFRVSSFALISNSFNLITFSIYAFTNPLSAILFSLSVAFSSDSLTSFNKCIHCSTSPPFLKPELTNNALVFQPFMKAKAIILITHKQKKNLGYIFAI